MKLHLIESDSVYRELLTLPVDQRDAVFKEKLLPSNSLRKTPQL